MSPPRRNRQSMWKRVLLAGLLASACAGLKPRPPSAHVREVARGDGSSVIVLWGEPAGTKRHPVLLYLSGSGCASAAPTVRYLSALAELGYAFVAPEKRGVKPGDTGEGCGEEFLSTNRRQQRLDDAKKAVGAAAGLFPRWDGRLIVIGASEGGGIAAELADEERRTVALVSLAGGGLSQAEELKLLRRQGLEARGVSEAERAASLAELDDALEAIRKEPNSTRSWLGADNTHLRWASYLWYVPATDFARVDVPTYQR
jgi:dienelactone hydrolase